MKKYKKENKIIGGLDQVHKKKETK